MQIYNIISIAYLEPTIDPTLDLYQRRRLLLPAVVKDGYDEYEIGQLLRKRRIRRRRGWSI